MNKSRTAYEHISETVQGHSAHSLLTYYEIDTSECAVYQPESDENT